MLEVYRALSASPETMSPELLAKLEVAPKANSAHLVLTYAAIWAVKISFLDFFRRIYRNLMTWMRYWWIVFWITAAGCVGTLTAWTVILTTINYRCLGDGAAPEEMACPDNYGDEVWKRIAVAYISSCTLDISTDIISESSDLNPLLRMPLLIYTCTLSHLYPRYNALENQD
jgi:hypothetical protein